MKVIVILVVLCLFSCCIAEPLFPFGSGQGDTLDPVNCDDCCSAPYSLPSPFKFYNIDRTEIIVTSNGLAVLTSTCYDTFTPVPFPSASQPIIAPYWGDGDLRGSGM